MTPRLAPFKLRNLVTFVEDSGHMTQKEKGATWVKMIIIITIIIIIMRP